MDLIIKNAKLREKDNLVEIGIHGGKIVKIDDKIGEMAEKTIDACGKLTTPTFIEPHIHLDKVFLSETASEAKTIAEARERMREMKKKHTVESVKQRASRFIQLALSKGVTKIRTHVDVDTISGLTPLRGILETKKEFRNLVDMQVVAFPQEGILIDQGTEELLMKAMELKADLIGGLPESELTQDDSRRHIDVVFDIAKRFNVDIDMHVDVVPYSNTVEYYVAKAIKEKCSERLTSIHNIGLSFYNDSYAARIIRLLKQAKMNVVTCPCTLMYSGITRVRELMDAGVNVVYGQDNLLDPYYSFGDADILKGGFLLAHGAKLQTATDIKKIFDMPTFNSAAILGIQDYGIEVGKTADLNVLDAYTEQDALRTMAERLYVVRGGIVVAENKTERKYYGEPNDTSS